MSRQNCHHLNDWEARVYKAFCVVWRGAPQTATMTDHVYTVYMCTQYNYYILTGIFHVVFLLVTT